MTNEVTEIKATGTKPVLMWVPTDQLHVNHLYQRYPSTKRGERVIQDICAKFHWPLFQPISIVTREEGGYWVIRSLFESER